MKNHIGNANIFFLYKGNILNPKCTIKELGIKDEDLYIRYIKYKIYLIIEISFYIYQRS